MPKWCGLSALLFFFAFAAAVRADEPEAEPAAAQARVLPAVLENIVDPTPSQRAFGVLPNNRTAESALPFVPISAKRKLTIGFKDSFDWPIYLNTALFASIYHAENQNPSFGQGFEGYTKRLATSFADQTMGNMMTEGVVPALTHQDPRYFRLGSGSKGRRVLNALAGIFVARMDSGTKTFNFSEWGGNSVAVAVSNLYYPDTRTARDNAQKLGFQCATDAFSNVLKEFWPDVKRYFEHRRERKQGLLP